MVVYIIIYTVAKVNIQWLISPVLMNEFAPYLERAVGVNGSKAGQEVVFGGLDGYFCCIDAMVVGFNELYLGLVGLDVCFNRAEAFIV